MHTVRRMAACLAVCLAVQSLMADKASAFSSAVGFVDGSRNGGGGGRWFTGSPAEGYDCAVCHSSSPLQRPYPMYLSGLTAQYEPDATYTVSLAWPEFATFFSQQAQLAAQNPAAVPDPPAMGLVAEFVADSGRASGTLEFDVAQAGAAEYCMRTRPNLNPRFGAQVFQVRPGLEPRELKAGEDGILRCEANQLGQRCVISMRSCGAQQVRFRWIAPGEGAGPVWFSAGFVATDRLSGSFDSDSVDLFSYAMLQAGTEEDRYARVVRGGCALSIGPSGPGGAARGPLGVVAVMLCGLALRRRWPSRRGARPARAGKETTS